MPGNLMHSGGHHPGAHPTRMGHILRVAWIALLVILVLLIFAPKAGGTKDLMALAATVD